jgi:hypothetical protein
VSKQTPTTIYGPTIKSIVSGMRDAFDCESLGLKQLALNVGATALEKLLCEHEHAVRLLNQCIKATVDEAPRPANADTPEPPDE